MRLSTLLLSVSVLLSVALPRRAKAQSPTSCGPPPAILKSTQPNIFSEQQEQWLGEATAELLERNERPVRDPALNAYLEHVGKRLLAVLPPSQFQFRFVLLDSAEINGFSMAGGRIYINRKLVAAARNEDEVAGVIGHEMGHILTHQFAIETTADLRRLLKITSVGDRDDIFRKFKQLTDAREHEKGHPGVETDEAQDEADRVAVYAEAAAGYRPAAYAEFWDRVNFTNGKAGSRLGDLFGVTRPDQKRLRRIRAIVAALPAGCGAPESSASADFLRWQAAVVANQTESAAEASAAAASAEAGDEVLLDPPLRLDLDQLRFSRDGRYILAQDESSIFVLTRDPFAVLFPIPAENAVSAGFTPDSRTVAFVTSGLHVERWSVADHTLTDAHEIVTPQPCLKTILAPDARTVVCLSFSDKGSEVALLDVDTGKSLWEKHQVGYALDLVREGNSIRFSIESPYALSADGNSLLIGPHERELAFDLRTRTALLWRSPEEKHSSLTTPYCFLGNDKVLQLTDPVKKVSSVYSFPDGKLLQTYPLATNGLHATTNDRLVVVPPLKDYSSALVEASTGKVLFVTRLPALDAFENTLVAENTDGDVILAPIDSADSGHWKSLTLPLSPFAHAGAGSISPDGRYLALSARTRGAIWDLTTGNELFAVRGFERVTWTSGNTLLAEFPKLAAKPAAIVEFTMDPKATKVVGTPPADQPVHLIYDSLAGWIDSKDKRSSDFIVRSAAGDTVRWSRHYSGATPAVTGNIEGDEEIIFSYRLQLATAKDRLKGDPALKEQVDRIHDKAAARIVEVVNPSDGTTREETAIEVPRSYEGVDTFNRVGDLLYLNAGDNRTFVYSLKTGAQLRQAFGSLVAADAASGRVCLVNRRDELLVLDHDGRELRHLQLGAQARFAALRNQGTELLVLTVDQRVRRYRIDPLNAARLAENVSR